MGSDTISEIRAALAVIEKHSAEFARLVAAVEPKPPTVFYFGVDKDRRCGHGWCDGTGGTIYDYARMPARIDGVYAPRDGNRNEAPQGHCRQVIVGEWTIVAWWDRSGDPRGACNSALAARGLHSFDAMIAAGRAQYPWVFERLAKAGVQIVAERA